MEAALNYRHHFHAGNFADVMKHAILLALIRAMAGKGATRVVETHAGAGLYDLHGEAAQRSSEAESGVERLMTAEGAVPAALEALRAAVLRANPGGGLRFYPGSPLLAVGAGAAYAGCELREDDFASLQAVLARVDTSAGEFHSLHSKTQSAKRPTESRSGSLVSELHSLHSKTRVQQADGYAALAGLLSGGELVLIDPPFERGDDYDQAAEAVGVALKRHAAVAVWAPIKDLETLDALARRIEALRPHRFTLAEVRLRPLANPMKMNGCAMLLVDTPDIEAEVGAVCDWVATHCGEAGAQGGLTRLVE